MPPSMMSGPQYNPTGPSGDHLPLVIPSQPTDTYATGHYDVMNTNNDVSVSMPMETVSSGYVGGLEEASSIEVREEVVLHINDVDWNKANMEDNVEIHVMKEPKTAKVRDNPIKLTRQRKPKIKIIKQFICHYCAHESKRQSDLKTHLRTHTGEKPEKCPFCVKRFARRDHLLDHIRIHTDEKPYTCPICFRLFSVKTNLNKHIRIHTGNKPFVCQICSKSFRRRSQLRVHSATHNKHVRMCEICGESVSESLEKHMESSHSNVVSIPDSSNENAVSHDVESVIEHQAELPCYHCGKMFHSHLDLMEHIDQYLETVRNETETETESDVIQSTLESQTGSQEAETITSPPENSLLSDAERGGQNEIVYVIADDVVQECSIDSQVDGEIGVGDGEDYQTEIEVVVSPGVVEEATEALIHDLTARTNINLTDQIHVCEVCQLTFNHSSNLTVHKRTHSGQKPYTCTCGKSFTDKSNYNRHLKTHTSEKPYQCEQCPASFKRKSHLQNHVRQHENKREFVCSICSDNFNYYSALINHMKIHNTDGLKCKFCDMQFTNTQERGRHMKYYHEEVKCECGSRFTSIRGLEMHRKKKHQQTGNGNEDSSEMKDTFSGLDQVLESIVS